LSGLVEWLFRASRAISAVAELFDNWLGCIIGGSAILDKVNASRSSIKVRLQQSYRHS